MTASLKFNVKTIREKGRLEVRESLPQAAFQDCLAENATLKGPLSASLDFTAGGADVLLRGSVSGRWELECCRCLSRKEFPCLAAVEAAFAVSEGAIDAAEEVRQALVLALPTRVYCGPDCKGLCLRCGANKNERDCACPPQPVFNALRQGEKDA